MDRERDNENESVFVCAFEGYRDVFEIVSERERERERGRERTREREGETCKVYAWLMINGTNQGNKKLIKRRFFAQNFLILSKGSFKTKCLVFLCLFLSLNYFTTKYTQLEFFMPNHFISTSNQVQTTYNWVSNHDKY